MIQPPFSCYFLLLYEIRTWICNAIYVSPVPLIRKKLWEYLKHVHGTIHHPWLLIGDFNEILIHQKCVVETFVTLGLRFSLMFWRGVGWWIWVLMETSLLGSEIVKHQVG